MIKNITYENKEAIQNNPDLPKKNMVTDADMNEIKTVVNNNADELNTTKENVENLQEGQGTANTDIANLKSRVSTLETDNTKNKSDIENLQNDNETNQSNIGELRQKTEQIEENISDIQQEQETQNTEIKNLQQEVQELEQDVKANALEEETEQAKSLYITDASGARGKLKVFGNDEQETREGKNLWNDTSIENKKFSELTNTQVSTSNLALTEGDYCFKLFFTDGTYMQTNINIQLKNVENTTLKTISNQASVTLTAEEAKQIVSGVCWTNSTGLADYANKTIAGLMLVKGTTLTDGYEKYGASPSLDYPSAIKSLGSNINLYPGWEKNTISSETGEPEIDPNYIRSVDFISVLPNKNYTIKAYNIKEFGDLNTAVRMYDINKNYLSSKWIGSIINKSITFTLTNADVRYIKIVCSNNNTVTNTAKVDIKLEEGEIATSYSPYGQGSTEIKQYNKNLAESIEIFSTSGQYGTMCIAGYTIKKGEKYTISFNTPNSGTDCYLQNSWEIKLSYDGGYYYTNLDGTRKSIVVTATETGYFKSTKGIILKRTNDSKETGLISNFMIEKWNGNDKASDYEETKKNIFNIDIQQEMLKGDYFNLERKKEVHNWNKKIWNGTENWTVDSQNTNDTYISFKTQIDDMISLNNQNTQLIADKIINEYGGIALNKEHLWVYGIYIEVCVKKERLETLDATGFKKLLAQNNINIFYKLATPTELDLTESQIEVLEKLNKLRFFKGTNNILTTEDIALLQAKYSVNIQSKINSLINAKISELNQPELLNK